MNMRLTWIAALAVVLASLTLNSVLAGNGWLGFGIGAVVVVALAGLATRMSGLLGAATTTALVLLAAIPLLTGPTWGGRAAALVVVALTAGSAAGWRTLRGFAVLACYAAVLLLYLNLAFAGGPSFGHVIPSNASLHMLRGLYDQAFVEFKSAPPVPDISGVSLVAAGGMGLVAIMVDLVAVRLRRPALAGLPLLILFSVPVATNLKSFGLGQSLTFAAGLVGYLVLLSADGRERLRVWGRLVTFRYVQSASQRGPGPDTSELGAAGRRIGLAAICLAVLVPAILPTMRARDLFAGPGNGLGISGSGSGPLSPLLNIQHQLSLGKPEPVLSYTTTAARPAQQYLQMYVLNYNARLGTWLPQFPATGNRVLDGSAAPFATPGVTAATPTTSASTTISLRGSAGQTVLPMPYAPTQVIIGSEGWTETPGTLMVYGGIKEPTLHYTVLSSEPDPNPAQIITANANAVQAPLSIQRQYEPTYTGADANRILSIATLHITAGAPLQEAIDLQDWFLSGSFKYSLKHIPTGKHWLLDFLTKDKRGICQQYAWAFAIIARMYGIPSRIAVGYTGGQLAADGSWQVTTADAHAWPELYFPGEGWLRFEPTPGGPTGQGTAHVPGYATGPPTKNSNSISGQNGQTSGNGQAPPTKTGNQTPNNLTHLTSGGGSAAGHHHGSSLGTALGVGIPLAVLLLLALPALIRIATRRRRWLAAAGDAGLAHAAWLELTDDLADFGLPCQPGETTRVVSRRVTAAASLDPLAAQAIGRISLAEERARYALSPLPGPGLAADVLTVRRAVAATVPRRRRLRARLLPASTVAAIGRVLQQAVDVFSLLESSWPAMRRALVGTRERGLADGDLG
ncbi:MAG TPA: transglutaminaseTgpA domain-containing protein [Streptosporangiaceae bacterium]